MMNLTPNKLSLEEELSKQEKTVSDYYDLIEELKVTMKFLLYKFEFCCKNSFSDNNVYFTIFDCINLEIKNIIAKSNEIIKLNKLAILPVSNQFIPEEDIDEVLLKVELFIEKYSDFIDHQNFRRYKLLGSDLLSQVATADQMWIEENKIVPTFEKMFQRYKDENKNHINCYIEEIDSVAEAKKKLRDKYEDCKAVEIWKHTGHDILRTIKGLKKIRAVQMDILPLFDYILKYEILHNLPSDKAAPFIHVNTDKVEIKEAGDIITEGGVKNVNNRK